jgi:hypothetical protein
MIGHRDIQVTGKTKVSPLINTDDTDRKKYRRLDMRQARVYGG